MRHLSFADAERARNMHEESYETVYALANHCFIVRHRREPACQQNLRLPVHDRPSNRVRAKLEGTLDTEIAPRRHQIRLLDKPGQPLQMLQEAKLPPTIKFRDLLSPPEDREIQLCPDSTLDTRTGSYHIWERTLRLGVSSPNMATVFPKVVGCAATLCPAREDKDLNSAAFSRRVLKKQQLLRYNLK